MGESSPYLSTKRRRLTVGFSRATLNRQHKKHTTRTQHAHNTHTTRHAHNTHTTRTTRTQQAAQKAHNTHNTHTTRTTRTLQAAQKAHNTLPAKPERGSLSVARPPRAPLWAWQQHHHTADHRTREPDISEQLTLPQRWYLKVAFIQSTAKLNRYLLYEKKKAC